MKGHRKLKGQGKMKRHGKMRGHRKRQSLLDQPLRPVVSVADVGGTLAAVLAGACWVQAVLRQVQGVGGWPHCLRLGVDPQNCDVAAWGRFLAPWRRVLAVVAGWEGCGLLASMQRQTLPVEGCLQAWGSEGG